MKKRLIGILLSLTMAVGLMAGCGESISTSQESPSSNSGETEQASGGSESSGLTEKIELSLGHGQQGSSAPGKAIEAFAQKVKEDSDGMIEITVYPAAQIGAERDLMEGLSMGSVDMGYISAGVTENYAPTAGIFNLPFIFDDYDHAQAVMADETVCSTIQNELTNSNIKLLTPLIQGNRYLWTTKEVDFGDLSTLEGLKIRVPEAPMAVGIWKALKANPTAISWAELYTAMSTKIVNAFEVHAWAVTMENLQETFNYAYLTNHQTSVALLMFSQSVWDSLPEEARQIILNNIDYLIDENAANIISGEEEELKTIQEDGIKITELTDDQKNQIRERCADLTNGWVRDTENAQTLYDVVQSLR